MDEGRYMRHERREDRRLAGACRHDRRKSAVSGCRGPLDAPLVLPLRNAESPTREETHAPVGARTPSRLKSPLSNPLSTVQMQSACYGHSMWSECGSIALAAAGHAGEVVGALEAEERHRPSGIERVQGDAGRFAVDRTIPSSLQALASVACV